MVVSDDDAAQSALLTLTGDIRWTVNSCKVPQMGLSEIATRAGPERDALVMEHQRSSVPKHVWGFGFDGKRYARCDVTGLSQFCLGSANLRRTS